MSKHVIRHCGWCGTPLVTTSAAFCVECNAPQTWLAKALYVGNFIAKNFAIPLAIGVLTLILAAGQQEAAIIVANRQKLAEALGEVGKVQADYRLADTQIAFMASSGGSTVPAKDLKDAALKLDVAIASFGQKLGPFEEFARRTKYYTIKPHEASPLQNVWDRCFVLPYWGDGRKPAYFQQISQSLSKCDDTVCPRAVAQELRRVYDDFYQGFCSEEQPVKQVPNVWFNRELRRISIQAPPAPDLYKLGTE